MVASPSRTSIASAPWPGSGRPRVDAEEVGDRAEPAEPFEAGDREDHRVEASVGDVREPGVDVAAKVDHLEVGTPREQLGATSRRTGADARAGLEVGEREVVASAQGVAGIRALGHGADREAGVWRGRQVLEGVHDEVALAAHECLTQRAGEDAGAAEILERLL